jgi:hypothetical protein
MEDLLALHCQVYPWANPCKSMYINPMNSFKYPQIDINQNKHCENVTLFSIDKRPVLRPHEESTNDALGISNNTLGINKFLYSYTVFPPFHHPPLHVSESTSSPPHS